VAVNTRQSLRAASKSARAGTGCQ